MSEKGYRILMIEDDPAVLELNRKFLARRGMDAISAKTLKEARNLLREPFDLILLDIQLPDGSGLDFVKEIRAVSAAPILMLTGLKDDADIVAGLLGGGDDYLTKPYRIDELHARVVAQIRRSEMAQTLARGPITLDIVAGRALLNGDDMLLTPRDFSLLQFFIQNENRCMETNYVYEKIWRQPMAGDSQALGSAVSRLRKKLTGSGYTISVRYKNGYCFEREEA